MGLDGSDRTETITFAANQEFLRPMVTDGDFIYACMWETSDNSMESFLVRIDPTAGTCEKMFSMDSTWIKGVVGDKLLLKSTSGDNSEWFTYDPVTGEQAVLYTESSNLPPFTVKRWFIKRAIIFISLTFPLGKTPNWRGTRCPIRQSAM